MKETNGHFWHFVKLHQIGALTLYILAYGHTLCVYEDIFL